MMASYRLDVLSFYCIYWNCIGYWTVFGSLVDMQLIHLDFKSVL